MEWEWLLFFGPPGALLAGGLLLAVVRHPSALRRFLAIFVLLPVACVELALLSEAFGDLCLDAADPDDPCLTRGGFAFLGWGSSVVLLLVTLTALAAILLRAPPDRDGPSLDRWTVRLLAVAAICLLGGFVFVLGSNAPGENPGVDEYAGGIMLWGSIPLALAALLNQAIARRR